MSSFSTEEKLDLLIKKIAFGKAKTETSENTNPFGEATASPLLLRADKVWKESGNIPTSPPNADTSQVELYTGADTVECTAVSAAQNTNISGFKRSWTTGQTDWIPPEFGANYLVKVYVGPTGWNGTDEVATTVGGTDGAGTGAQVFQVEPGNADAEWYFDYQAGILYWVNENESGTLGASTSLTDDIAGTDKVYIQGYKYIGAFGVGGDGAVTATSTVEGLIELFSDTVQTVGANAVSSTASRTYGLQLNSDGQAVINVPWSDTNTTYSAATSTTAGLIELGSDTVQTVAAESVSATASRTYSLQVNSDGQGVVNVPWSDTNTTYSAATSTTAGLIELGSDTVQTVAANSVSATASRSYALQVNSDGQGVVNVPWSDTNTTYSAATSTTAGLIELGSDTVQTVAANSVSATASRSYSLQVNSDGQGVVNVPWTDTNTTYSLATSTTLGLIELGSDTVQTVAANSVSATASRTYSLQVNSDGQGVVNVPWSDTNTTYSAATSTTAGLIELGSDTVQTVAANSVTATASRSYALQVNSDGQGVVNVPWSDTNTTYSAATSTAAGLIELGSDTVQTVAANSVSATASRTYALQVNSDGQGVVNVPWTDTSGINNISVAEGADGAAHKVVLTTAGASGTFTGVQIDTADLTYTPSSTTDRGKLTTGDLLVKGDLTVIGAGTVVNMQTTNVYVEDALITLGITDTDGDTDFTDGTAAGVDVGIEAYKQNHDGTAHPALTFDISANYWTVHNKDHAASTQNKIAEKFVSAAYAWTATNESNGYAEITHNLNTQRIVVQVTNSDEEIVYVKFIANTLQKARIYIAGAVETDEFDIVIIG